MLANVFDATPAQIRMIQDPALLKIWACGRRWGKTILMAIALTVAALEWEGCTVWYVSPRYARSLKMMRVMWKSEGFRALGAKQVKQFPPRFEMPNGSEICFISADREDELRGEGLRRVCVDETAILSKYLFYEVLMPMTADSGGDMIAGSTFNGRNWFYDMAREGMPMTPHAKKLAIGADPDTKTWVYPSSTGYAFTGSEEKRLKLERLKKKTPPLTWQQEYDCEPLAVIDAVFMYVDQCIGGMPQPAKYGKKYVVAQDIGRIVDASGVVVMELPDDANDSAAECAVVHVESYALGTPHKQQAARTKAIAEHYNNALIVLDTTGGGTGGRAESCIKEYNAVLKGKFNPVTFTLETKRSMVNTLALDFENQRVKIPPQFTELISQLKLYRYHFGEKAILPVFYGRPDDLVAAMMMCSHARERGWEPGTNVGNFGTY